MQRTEGFAFGLRALGRVASLNPIWASPRPILPFASSNDIAHRNILLGLVMVAILVAVTVMARRHGHRALLSMCILSIAALLGTVILFASTPVSYYEAFIWINLELWLVGLCVWITLGLAAVVAIRPQLAVIGPQIAALRPRTASPHSARRKTPISVNGKRTGALLTLGAAGIAGMLVVVFPYGNQFLLNWAGMARAQQMTSAIEAHVPKGHIGIGVKYSGPDPFQLAGDEHGAAYLLLTDGWVPGMEPQINQLLGMPIDKNGPFVVFTERGQKLVSARYYHRYPELWFLRKT